MSRDGIGSDAIEAVIWAIIDISISSSYLVLYNSVVFVRSSQGGERKVRTLNTYFRHSSKTQRGTTVAAVLDVWDVASTNASCQYQQRLDVIACNEQGARQCRG